VGLESSAASQFSTVVRRLGRAVLRLVRRVAGSRIRVALGSLPALDRIWADLVPSILRVRDLPALAPAVLADRAHGLGLAHGRGLALRVRVDLEQVLADRRLRAKLHALRVPRDRRAAVAVSNIPRPKKAR
jgi:hypothetical protein